ncbi:hemerythrin domain-containing protein [Pedomonas sp. V897]|uniref:hemerythrin domain-containing protein n=1 Tax=Pedomonas sp. V897 TaxID=3446482 RepID=UPI003EE1560E
MPRQRKDIFDALTADHDRHRSLLKTLGNGNTASDKRMALFEELTRELKGHAAAEEQALYSVILAKPEMTDKARHSVAEHKEIDDLLNHLATVDIATKEWSRKFAELSDEYIHHIDEEEEELFPDASDVLTEADEVHMRVVFERRKKVEKAQAEITPEVEPEK